MNCPSLVLIRSVVTEKDNFYGIPSGSEYNILRFSGENRRIIRVKLNAYLENLWKRAVYDDNIF